MKIASGKPRDSAGVDNDLRKKIGTALILASCLVWPCLCRADEATVDRHAAAKPKEVIAYEARWWISADEEERSGFFWGIGDCLSSDAGGLQGLRFDLDDLHEAIGNYYKSHPGDAQLSIVEVWAKLQGRLPVHTHPEDGERYRNPHGFLDGSWYRMEVYPKRIGYLQGYLGCLKTYVNDPPQSYSHTIGYYDDHVWNYIGAHSSGYDEAVAVILSRFRDRGDGKRGPLPPIVRKYPHYVSPEFPVQKDWRFDGRWWMDDAESPERLGFIEGTQDYLTWMAHDEAFSAWPVQVVSAISAYYKMHSDDQNALVLNVWRTLAPQIPEPTSAERRDPWRQKPKGRYLATPWFSADKLWWQVEEDRREGFIEGYIWCELNYSDQPSATYSSSPYDYEEKIGEYLMAHPKAVNQPLADLLYLFRDKSKAN